MSVDILCVMNCLPQCRKCAVALSKGSEIDPSRFECPMHTCVACREGNRSGREFRWFRCVGCPLAFHKACVPSHFTFFPDGDDGPIPRFVCDRHPELSAKLAAQLSGISDNVSGSAAGVRRCSFKSLPQNFPRHILRDVAAVFCDGRLPVDFKLSESLVKPFRGDSTHPPPYKSLRRNVYHPDTGGRPKLRSEDVQVGLTFAWNWV